MSEQAPGLKPPVSSLQPEPAAADILEVRGLIKEFHDFWGRPFVRAVAGLDLTLKPGEVFGLLGPNGSGKTTTIKMLLGLLKPTAGSIRLFGGSPEDAAVRRRTGYLPEENILFQHQRCRHELRLIGRFYGLAGPELEERTELLLRKVGIWPAREQYLREFSKGMGRRHGLARALIGDPELLILDEPTSGLDPIGVREVKDLILELKAQGKTVLLSSHLLADVEEVCDRIAIMYLGRAILHGTLDELLAAPEGAEIVVSDQPLEKVRQAQPELARLLGQNVRIAARKVRLEQVFVAAVRNSREV